MLVPDRAPITPDQTICPDYTAAVSSGQPYGAVSGVTPTFAVTQPSLPPGPLAAIRQ